MTDRRIQWSDEFVLIDLDAPLAELVRIIDDPEGPYYILLRRARDLLYVFLPRELARLPEIKRYRYVEPPPKLTIGEVVKIHEDDSSHRAGPDGVLLPYPYGVSADRHPQASRERVVALNAVDTPIYVGEDIDNLTLGGDRRPRTLDLRALPTTAKESEAVPRDEGTDPIRYPSIAADRELVADQPVEVTVDLLRERTDTETESRGVALEDLPGDWIEVEVQVELVSSAIHFNQPTGAITVRRNADSLAASFPGTVRSGLVAGAAAKVVALFSYAGRNCGMAARTFTVGQVASTESTAPTVRLVVETAAEPPDFTVHILRLEASAPGKLNWSMAVPPRADTIPGLPDRLAGLQVDLGGDLAAYATRLYQQFKDQKAGKPDQTDGAHMALFRGVGDELWLRTPEAFRRSYWALRDALHPGFSIQFITDDPYVPWELMRPYREETHQTAEILALEHPVARCIAEYEGRLRQRLSAGRVVTIAPKYSSAQYQLPRAQDEAKILKEEFGAKPVDGTAKGLMDLLREGLPDEQVGIIHFAGHGEFARGPAQVSSIKLEDRSLAAVEVGAREVMLGERSGPLVVFNACDVGRTGESLGASGGWAEVFLRRGFRGFVAPLWPVYDEDAPVVIKELFEAVVTQRKPVGRALQEIRSRHGRTSPTFLAYLYYGDVLARLPPATG